MDCCGRFGRTAIRLTAARTNEAFFDTSVLVPVFLKFDRGTGCCGAHSLAQAYSTLTRMPGKHRISGAQAMLFVDDICERLSLVTLEGHEHVKALQFSASLGVVGGGIYDALLAQCAIKAQAETIYSWNVPHYAQCGPDVTRRLQRP